MTTIIHHTPLNAGGTTARRQDSRYDNDPRVTRIGDEYTVDTGAGTYVVRRNDTAGWGIYIDDGVDLLTVAGGGHATGILTADQAIGALIGDAR